MRNAREESERAKAQEDLDAEVPRWWDATVSLLTDLAASRYLANAHKVLQPGLPDEIKLAPYLAIERDIQGLGSTITVQFAAYTLSYDKSYPGFTMFVGFARQLSEDFLRAAKGQGNGPGNVWLPGGQNPLVIVVGRGGGKEFLTNVSSIAFSPRKEGWCRCEIRPWSLYGPYGAATINIMPYAPRSFPEEWRQPGRIIPHDLLELGIAKTNLSSVLAEFSARVDRAFRSG